jgi:hypothetical protein
MRVVLLLLIACTLGGQLFAQKINIGKETTIRRNLTDEEKVRDRKIKVGQLLEMLDWNNRHIDTTLKKQGYLLMQKDVDSGSALYQYSSLDRKKDAPTVIRAFTYMDASREELKSRLITYRTYDKDEFTDMSSYLLLHNYTKTNYFDFGDAKHTLYSNGKFTVRSKVITLKLKDGKTATAYELELGK